MSIKNAKRGSLDPLGFHYRKHTYGWNLINLLPSEIVECVLANDQGEVSMKKLVLLMGYHYHKCLNTGAREEPSRIIL